MKFIRWAETYGPIYSIRIGAPSMVVVSLNEIAKEGKKANKLDVAEYIR
ncbi:putative ent-kaurene monooxygenase [Helianthus annuus]|nr:putative ent-kaurene monooxygenase [Helianthus annuus]KAJ0897051.1 putative ent-kaurene monooxygenase [Helianthus annuus]